MKNILTVVLLGFSLMLSGCAMFTKTKLVPQAYMPEPPEILMRKPKELNAIKNPEQPQSQPAQEPEPQP